MVSGFGKKGEEETETKQRDARRVRGTCETKCGGGQFPSLFLFLFVFGCSGKRVGYRNVRLMPKGMCGENGVVGGACIGQTGLTEAGAGEKI